MSIQQSLNQLLSTAAIGTGIYSQTPTSKRKQELRQLKADVAEFSKAGDVIAEEGDIVHAAEATKREAEMRKRIAELEPTVENVREAGKYVVAAEDLAEEAQQQRELMKEEQREKWRAISAKRAEQNAAAAMANTVSTRTAQQDAFAQRKELLKSLRDEGVLSNTQYKKLDYKLKNKEGGNN